MNKIDELAKMIDHSILHPTLTDEDLERECMVAVKYNVASVCVKPYAVKKAAGYIKGSEVINCCVIGFPHGNNLSEVKAFETRKACLDGATEIDMVVNIGKVLGEDWDFVEAEIDTINNICKQHKAQLKVIFENDYYRGRDDLKIRLCEICTRVGVAWIKTSTGYGFVKGPDGKYSYEGATPHDLKLMRKHAGPEVQIKAAGGIRTLDDLLLVKELGCTRCGATATIAILEEAKKRFMD